MEEVSATEGDGGAENDHEDGEEIELEPVVLDRVEEAGSQLESDGEDEEDEPEFLEKRHEMRIQGQAEVAKQEAAEKHSSDAEFHATKLDAADEQPEDRRQGNDQNGLGVGRNFSDAVEEGGHAGKHRRRRSAGQRICSE